jgi:hypothetical protein
MVWLVIARSSHQSDRSDPTDPSDRGDGEIALPVNEPPETAAADTGQALIKRESEEESGRDDPGSGGVDIAVQIVFLDGDEERGHGRNQ